MGAGHSEIPAASAGMTEEGGAGATGGGARVTERGARVRREGVRRLMEGRREVAWVLVAARYPRRSAGMTKFFRAGMTEEGERGCDGGWGARV